MLRNPPRHLAVIEYLDGFLVEYLVHNAYLTQYCPFPPSSNKPNNQNQRDQGDEEQGHKQNGEAD